MKSYAKFYYTCPYILNIFIDEQLNESEQTMIVSTIYERINEKEIEKNIAGSIISIKWSVANEINLLQYYTKDSSELLSDQGIHEHTKQVLNDIREIIGKHKISFIITKPLTKQVCMI